MPRDAVRPARVDDVPHLVGVEVGAGRLFREIGMVEVAAHEPDPDELLGFVHAHRAWVIEVAGTPVAYATAELPGIDARARCAMIRHNERTGGAQQWAG